MTQITILADWSADVNSAGGIFVNDGDDLCGGLNGNSVRVAQKFILDGSTGQPALPAGATVTQVQLRFQVLGVLAAGALLWDIDGYGGTGLADPEVANGATLFAGCGITGVYIDNTTQFRTAGVKTLNLGAQAVADLQAARVAGNRFSVALRETTDTTTSAYALLAEFTAASDANKPALIVDFTVGATVAGFTAAAAAGAEFSGVGGAPGSGRVLLPNAVLASSNLKDSTSASPPTDLSDLTDDPVAPDTDWWTAVEPAGDIDVRFGFQNLIADEIMTGSWTVDLWLRNTAAAPVTVDVELWENGTYVATLAASVPITSTVGQRLQVPLAPALLSDPRGIGAADSDRRPHRGTLARAGHGHAYGPGARNRAWPRDDAGRSCRRHRRHGHARNAGRRLVRRQRRDRLGQRHQHGQRLDLVRGHQLGQRATRRHHRDLRRHRLEDLQRRARRREERHGRKSDHDPARDDCRPQRRADHRRPADQVHRRRRGRPESTS